VPQHCTDSESFTYHVRVPTFQAVNKYVRLPLARIDGRGNLAGTQKIQSEFVAMLAGCGRETSKNRIWSTAKSL
jgi:hypothetical protein